MGADRAPFGTPRDPMGIQLPVFSSGSRNQHCPYGGYSRRPFDENVRAGVWDPKNWSNRIPEMGLENAVGLSVNIRALLGFKGTSGHAGVCARKSIILTASNQLGAHFVARRVFTCTASNDQWNEKERNLNHAILRIHAILSL